VSLIGGKRATTSYGDYERKGLTMKQPSMSNLTELEIQALSSGINVADGHPRHELTCTQQKVIDQLPQLFVEASNAPVSILEDSAASAYYGAVGQDTAVSLSTILPCYSSSVAMEIFARALSASGRLEIALMNPTFDNIPDILSGVGATLHPISEEALRDGNDELPSGIDVLFITSPNNPTGTVISAEALSGWAQACAARNVILAIDASFRGFDKRAQFDHYAILDREGCDYVVLEDTGKLWPTHELKIGFLTHSRDIDLPLRRIHTDILLGVSPLILLLIERLAQDARNGGFNELHRLIRLNRTLLRAQLEAVPGLGFPDVGSKISVERIELPVGCSANGIWKGLQEKSIHVLPCQQFFWANPDAGRQFIRVALGRNTKVIEAAAGKILHYLSDANT
jgi:enduracididine biosynthesis enzyme MppP